MMKKTIESMITQYDKLYPGEKDHFKVDDFYTIRNLSGGDEVVLSGNCFKLGYMMAKEANTQTIDRLEQLALEISQTTSGFDTLAFAVAALGDPDAEQLKPELLSETIFGIQKHLERITEDLRNEVSNMLKGDHSDE